LYFIKILFLISLTQKPKIMKKKVLATSLALALTGVTFFSFKTADQETCRLILCQEDGRCEEVDVTEAQLIRWMIDMEGYVVTGTECDTPTPGRKGKRKPRIK
jgi:hypothetical protein